jgi:hypothetical protein
VIPHRIVKRAENEELPLLGLRAISELRSMLDELETQHVSSARAKGASWEDIAAAIGITRQALQQRMRGSASPGTQRASLTGQDPGARR